MTSGDTAVRRIGSDSLLIAGRVEPGSTARLEFSQDGITWLPFSPRRIATGTDIVEKANILKSVPKRFYRFRMEAAE